MLCCRQINDTARFSRRWRHLLQGPVEDIAQFLGQSSPQIPMSCDSRTKAHLSGGPGVQSILRDVSADQTNKLLQHTLKDYENMASKENVSEFTATEAAKYTRPHHQRCLHCLSLQTQNSLQQAFVQKLARYFCMAHLSNPIRHNLFVPEWKAIIGSAQYVKRLQQSQP